MDYIETMENEYKEISDFAEAAAGHEAEPKVEGASATTPKADPAMTLPKQPLQHPDFQMDTRPPDNNKAMLIASCVIALVLVVAAIAFITPKVKTYASQKERISQLEEEITTLNQQKQQSASIDNQLQQLNTQSHNLQSAISAMQPAEMQAKMSQLQGQVTSFLAQTKALGLSGMVAKIQAMQQSTQGANVIQSIVHSLAQVPNGESVGQTFEAMRQSDPNVAQMTEGVASDDLKAAAMLLAMSQLRASLLRDNDSFSSDLALLKKTLASDDPQLQAAIDRMAPISEIGVLTPVGLANEFRGLGVDIVSASLSGEDVSIGDKAKARFSDLFTIEKNGQQISGSGAQRAVAAAQKKLDAGDVAGAVQILKTVQGPAAHQAQPFINQANATLMANQLQQVLGQNLLLKLKTGIGSLGQPQLAPLQTQAR